MMEMNRAVVIFVWILLLSLIALALGMVARTFRGGSEDRKAIASEAVKLGELLRARADSEPRADVGTQLGGVSDSMRRDVQDWLRETELSAETLATLRHNQVMRWAKIAGVAAVIGALAAIAAAIVPLVMSRH